MLEPLSIPQISFTPTNKPADYYLSAVKEMIIVEYFRRYFGRLPHSEFVQILGRVFRNKTAVMENLAKYVKKDVEDKGRKINESLTDISFFTDVLVEYRDKNIGQPIKR